MRFWQAMVTAQLAAGSVYADRFTTQPAHILAEMGSLIIGAAMWGLCEAGRRWLEKAL